MSESLIPHSHTAQRRNPERLTEAIDLALATPPAVHIPADFATRVAHLASAQQTPPSAVILPPPRYAHTAIVLCTITVLIALLTLIPGILARSPSHALTFTWLLCAEAVLLAAAFGPWRSFWTSAPD